MYLWYIMLATQGGWKKVRMKMYFWYRISHRIWYRHLWHRVLDPLGGYQTGILIELQTRPSQVTWYDTRPPSRSFHLQHKPICEENQLLVNIYFFFGQNNTHGWLSFIIGGLLCSPEPGHASIFHVFANNQIFLRYLHNFVNIDIFVHIYNLYILVKACFAS